MITICDISRRLVVRPMRTTFATSLGSKRAATSGLVTATLSDGTVGRGEVPTSFVMPHETVGAIRGILAESREALGGVAIEDYPIALEAFRRGRETFCMTLAGLEVALFRASLACRGESELDCWGANARTIETDITIPHAACADAVADWLDRAIRTGFTTYKIKVAGDVEHDLAFVAGVVERLRRQLPAFAVRLDGNQGYSARTYANMIRALEKARIGIELFEQPLRKDDWAGLKKIRGAGGVPMILDETVFSADNCRRVIDERLADGVNIKVAKSGIAESAAILRLARAAGLKLMIGCMTETMVGLSAGIRMAAGTGAFDYVDLDSVHFLYHRGSPEGIATAGPRYTLESR
ncbi:MAG: hypothetical protein NT031_09040 [Planctomycetota bacterium]|nr:hypothetical protein [Planctomycetota bacterium]